jgi:predicted NAD-dependent protein-ADP-ribosyltransferase YbiA (DUF1768 family)
MALVKGVGWSLQDMTDQFHQILYSFGPKKTVLLGRRRAKQLVASYPLKKQWKLVRDAIVAVFFFHNDLK